MAKKSQYKQKLDYNNAYNRNNYRSFSIRFSIRNETDIIQWLEEKKGIKSYLTNLIREDMAKNQNK